MRIIFGILSFCAAGLLACQIVPAMDQLVLPYLLLGKRSGYLQMQLGPFPINEAQICILEGVLALLALGFIFAGIYAITPRDTTA